MQPSTLDRPLQAAPGLPAGGYAHLRDDPADDVAHVLPINDQGGAHLVPDWAADLDADPRGWIAVHGASCSCAPTVRTVREGTHVTRLHIHHAFDGRPSGQTEEAT